MRFLPFVHTISCLQADQKGTRQHTQQGVNKVNVYCVTYVCVLKEYDNSVLDTFNCHEAEANPLLQV